MKKRYLPTKKIAHGIKNYRLETMVFENRMLVALVVIAILFGILIFRLAYLQIYKHRYYIELAQHNKTELFPVEANRGLIYDRNGVLLAENIPIFTLAIIPDYVGDIAGLIQELQKIIDIKQNNLVQFYKNLKQHQPYEHIPLKYKLTQEEVASVYSNQYRLPGIAIDTTMIRHYLFGEAATSVLGYVGKINPTELKSSDSAKYGVNSSVGKIGIEKYYESQLTGKLGYQQVEIDASGHIMRTLKSTPTQPGNDLYLSIDINLQKVAFEALGKENGSVVVIDPNNGQVLALVSTPSYDPNLFAYGIDSETFRDLQNSPDKPMYNRAIRGQFPPASTIKPFIALQALDTGVIDENYKIYDHGQFKLPNSKQVYRDWQPSGHGEVNVSKAITTSCDIFFYTISTKLGIARIGEIMRLFGFGAKTNIDLNEELSGIIASPQWKMRNTGKSWYLGDTVISAIGQGFMLVTPLQLASAIATIAKEGIRYQPQLLLKAKKPDGSLIEQKPIALPSVKLRDPKHWKLVIDALQNVVASPVGTAYRRLGSGKLGYQVAGKTGTAQLFHHYFNEENGASEQEKFIPRRLRNHSLFIAFAPTKDSKIAIAVLVENGSTAVIVARQIMDYYFGEELAKKANP
jgi:penicillin-binding protein 2